MLKKILAIANVGRIVQFSGRGNLAFRKLTLIYGENGRGKSTLSSVLRSLQSGDGTYVTERRTLGSSAPPEISILVDGPGLANFKNGKWQKTYPDLAVFDAAFIHDNVYAGDYVDHDHKKNLYRVIVGEEGVKLACRVDEIDGEIRQATADIRHKKAALAIHLPPGMELDRFIALPQEKNLDAQLSAAKTTLATLQRAAEIQAKKALQLLILPSLPEGFETLLLKELASVAHDAEQAVRGHLSRCAGERGEAWAEQGLEYAAAGTCPFCGRGIADVPLIAAYQGYFSAAYKGLKQEVAGMATALAARFSERAVLQLQQVLSGNVSLCEFWSQLVLFDNPELSFDNILPALETLREVGKRHLDRKMASPLESVRLDTDFTAALADYEQAVLAVELYNRAVTAANARIEEIKAAADLAATQKAAQETARLQAVQLRHSPAIDAACGEYETTVLKKKKLEKEKKDAKDRLDDYTGDILRRYQDRINTLLAQFNAGFRIDNTKTRYVGGSPSSSYEIVINEARVDLGDTKTPPGEPCFKNTLSSGDRSTLALAFFLARLSYDPRLSEKVVVFDDPITSQDAFRATQTQQLISRLYTGAKQVIVFSHDAHFLRRIWEETPEAEVITLQLSRAGEASVLAEWDIEAETRGEYVSNFYILSRYAKNGLNEDLRHVARCIRLVVEEYLRLKCPDQFPRNDTLGGFIRRIREAPAGNILASAHALLAELEDLNGFSKRYHHRDNPGFATEPITDTELQAYVKRTLALIGTF